MLALSERLRNRGEFTATVACGRRSARGGVVVHVIAPRNVSAAAGRLSSPGVASATVASDEAQPDPARIDEESTARAGFIVSRAVGGAVTRNLVRRRLRHLMRPRLAALPAGSMIVVRALPSAATATFDELGTDLDNALASATSGERGSRRSADRRSRRAVGGRTTTRSSDGGGRPS